MMKSRIYSASVFLRLCALMVFALLWLAPAQAQNVVSIPSVEGQPGQDITLSVNLKNTDPASALQIDLPLGDAVYYVDSSAVLNGARANGHSLSASLQGQTLRLVVYSLELHDLAGQEGALLSFRLRLKAWPGTYTLSPTVKLTDHSGNALTCSVQPGQLTISAPDIEVSETTVDFGRVAVGKSPKRTFTIRNTGTAPLHLSALKFRGSAFALDTYPASIPAGESANVGINFAPQRKGLFQDTLTILSNAVSGNQQVSLSATAYTVNVLSVGNASALCGDTATLVFNLRNMESVSAIQCAIELPEGVSLVASGATSLVSTHTAYASQNGRKLTLTLYSTTNALIPSGQRDILSLKLRAKATGGTYSLIPQNVVIGNGELENVVSSTTAGTLVVRSPRIAGPLSIDLGRVAVGATDTIAIPLQNSGDAILMVNSVSFLGSGYSVLTALPLSVVAGQSANLNVAYRPTEEGTFASSITVYSSDPSTPALSLTASSEVYTPNLVSVSGEVSGRALTANVDVALQNLSPITAFQMDLTCADGLSIKDNTAVATSRLASHSLNCRRIDDHTYRVSCYSLSNASIPQDTGAIYSVELEAQNQDALLGNLLTIDNIKLSTAQSRNMASQSAVLFSNEYIADYDSTTNTSSTQDHFIFSGVKDADMNTLTALSPSGDTNFLTVALQGGLDNASRRYTAFNMDVALPFGLEVVKEDGQPDVELPQDYSLYATSARSIAHSVASSMLNDTTLRVAVTSNANSSFLRASGDVLEMGVRVSSPYVKPGQNSFYFSGLNLTASAGGHKYKPEPGYQSVDVDEGEVSVAVNIPASAPFTTIVLPFGASLPRGVMAFSCSAINGSEAVLVPVDSLQAYMPYILYAKDGYSATLRGNLSAAAYNSRVSTGGVVSSGILKGAVRPQVISSGSVLSSSNSASSFRQVSSATTISSGSCWIANNGGQSSLSVSIPKYHLRFLADGAAVLDTLVEYHTAITTPAAPQKTGYTFLSWGEVPAQMPADSLAFTAQYSVNSYTVTFLVDGQIFRTDTLDYNSTITASTVPQREGYTFSGWQGVAKTVPAQNTTYEATFTPNKYRLLFMADGAAVLDTLVEYHTAITTPAAPQKTGYTFLSWGEVPAQMPADSLTFTAQYSVNSYTVTFLVDGQIFRTDTLDYNSTITAPTVPQREGYTFSGWQGVAKTVPAQNTTYEATFTPNKYRLLFMADGAAVLDTLVEYHTAITAPAAPQKTGYTFLSWGEVPAQMPADSLTFTAQYSVNSYTVTFLVDGQIFRTDTLDYNSTITAPTVPQREGYTFSGWQGVAKTVPAQNTTYEATFTPNKYRLLFMADGAAVLDTLVEYHTAITAPAAPQKTGYTFLSWGEVPAQMPADSLTFTAQYSVNSYTVTFLVDDDIYRVDSVEYGDQIILPDAPQKAGYMFEGWGEVPDKMPAENVVLTAGFTLLGDVNLDGVINSSDIVAIYNFIAQGEDSGTPLDRADINNDGVVNSSDVVEVYTRIANR